MHSWFKFLALTMFIATPARSDGNGPIPNIFRTIESIEYAGNTEKLTLIGIAGDGSRQTLSQLLWGSGSVLNRSCQTFAQQMMLKPGKWQLNVKVMASRITSCSLEPVGATP